MVILKSIFFLQLLRRFFLQILLEGVLAEAAKALYETGQRNEGEEEDCQEHESKGARNVYKGGETLALSQEVFSILDHRVIVLINIGADVRVLHLCHGVEDHEKHH